MTMRQMPTAQDVGSRAAFRRVIVLVTCTAVTFLYAMTVTIANVSLPQMQGALAATQDQIAWVLTLNIVATAVVTPVSGWLVARFGVRKLMLYGVVGFAAASLACGLAESLGSLVLYRVLQGAFGAPLVPVSQAIVQEIFPKRQHGIAIAIFGIGSVMGPIVGPVVGGLLSEALSWRWVFFMILPFTVVAFVSVSLFIHDHRKPKAIRLDWTGLVTLAVALTSVQLILDRGERADWFESTEIVVYCVLALSGAYLFVAHTLTTDEPFLKPTLLRDRNYAIGLVIVFVFGMLNFTPMTLLPALLQNIRGYPDSIIGFVLGARGVGTLVGFIFMVYASRFDPRKMIGFGFLLQAYAGWDLAQLDVNLTTWDVFWPIALQGFGVGILWVPITVVTFSTLSSQHMSEGTAVYHLMRNIGSSVHISISIALVIRMGKTSYSDLVQFISPFNDALMLPWVAGAWQVESPSALAALSGEVQRQASMIGYLDSFYFFAVTAVAVLPLVLLVRWKPNAP